MGKLFLFKAQNANIVLIVRRGNKRKQWQLIKWDLETDQFTFGQWLLNKLLWVEGCSISPCGKYFYWIYETYYPNFVTHAGISLIPNFTAIMYGNRGIGRHYNCRYDSITNCPINNSHGLEPRTGNLEMVNPTWIKVPYNNYSYEQINTLPNGLMKDIWEDYKKRRITTEGYKIIVDDVVFADFTENVFEPITPI